MSDHMDSMTIMHEAFHFFSFDRKLNLTEEQVTALEHFMGDFILSNPKIIQNILKVE